LNEKHRSLSRVNLGGCPGFSALGPKSIGVNLNG
jgi:hypothetical protein